jgi:hypothetical protein
MQRFGGSLSQICERYGSDGPNGEIKVICAYRTSLTNEFLRAVCEDDLTVIDASSWDVMLARQ